MSDNPFYNWGHIEYQQHYGGQEGDTRTISYWNVPTPKANDYHPNPAPLELIGVTHATLLHQEANYNGAGSPLTPGTAFTQTTFDTATRADAAKILLTNGSAANMVILAAAIRGARVYRLSGDNGFLHDRYVDYESIAVDGEKLYELGNNMICTLAQVNKLADIKWKWNKTKRHIYTITLAGFNTFYEPGEWYTLAIGSAGQPEYISSVVMVYSVRASLGAGGIGYTQIDFMEVYQNWIFDSNETARFMSGGGFNRKPLGRVVTVASNTFIGSADYYCDGTDDQTEINLAITNLSVSGGGVVRSTPGTFTLSTSIDLQSNIALELISGATIQKNGAFPAIKCVGSSSDHRQNIAISGGGSLIKSGNDTEISMVTLSYVDNLILTNMTIKDAGIYCNDSKNFSISDNYIETPFQRAMYLLRANYGNVRGNVIDGKDEDSPAFGNPFGITMGSCHVSVVSGNIIRNLYCSDYVDMRGISVGGSGSTEACMIVDNTMYNIHSDDTGSVVYGIYIEGDRNVIRNNKVELMKTTSASSNAKGIYISTGIGNQIGANYCINNGSDTGLANTNGCNFYDGGVDTLMAG